HRQTLRVHVADHLEHHVPALEEERVEHLVLGAEVVVDEPVGDTGLVGDVGDAAGVEALAREHAHGRVEDQAPLLRGRLRARGGRASGGGAHRAASASSGQRYAPGRRIASEGRLVRISRWRSRSSSATSAASPSSPAWASTAPHGSTIIERPPEWWPPGCSPVWLAAITNAWSSIARARTSVSQ